MRSYPVGPMLSSSAYGKSYRYLAYTCALCVQCACLLTPLFAGEHSNQNKIRCGNIGEYMVFGPIVGSIYDGPP